MSQSTRRPPSIIISARNYQGSSSGNSADSEKKRLITQSLDRFLSGPAGPHVLKFMLEIKNHQSDISLRMVDLFVTNYAREAKIKYEPLKEFRASRRYSPQLEADIAAAGCLPQENVQELYSNYRNQLRAYRKTYFDPFQRNERTDVLYGEKPGDITETTLAQINFFKWFVTNGVLHFMENHLPEIEIYMRKFSKSGKASAARCELSKRNSILSKGNGNENEDGDGNESGTEYDSGNESERGKTITSRNPARSGKMGTRRANSTSRNTSRNTSGIITPTRRTRRAHSPVANRPPTLREGGDNNTVSTPLEADPRTIGPVTLIF